MSSWGVPNEHLPLSIGGNVGILTSSALQIYSVYGERLKSLKVSFFVLASNSNKYFQFNDNVLTAFSNGSSATQRTGIVTETCDGVNLSIYDSKLNEVSTVKNVAVLSVLAGAISSCGEYVTLISGLPEFKIKLFKISERKLLAEDDFTSNSGIFHTFRF